MAQPAGDAVRKPPSLQLSLPSPAAEVLLPPLGPDDFVERPAGRRPPIIGVHRSLPPETVTLHYSDGAATSGAAKTSAEGAWRSTAVGRLWRLKTTSPGARALRVHFRDFDIGAGRLWLHSEEGQAVGPYTGRGLYGDGDFWSDMVFGDSLTIEYQPDPAGAAAEEEDAPFQIAAVSHIWDDAFRLDSKSGVRPPAAAARGAAAENAIKPSVPWSGLTEERQSLERSAAGDSRTVPTDTTEAARNKQWIRRAAASFQHIRPTAETLSPGLRRSFTLGPVDDPTLFHGDYSYRFEAPENATRVTFTVRSSADVDLYVRFGEDNDLRNGRVVTDYSSTGRTGNEEITIDSESNPPLRAGIYYASLALFDTGVVATGTITAEVELEEAAPPISGGLLEPGQPADFRLGPVDNPTLFTGGFSYRFETPENAVRLTFTLHSDNRAIDVDMFVRFGKDNEIRDGRVVSDYSSSRRGSGTEEITITRQSDPPLQEGTYFASLGLIDTGVAATGTITAEVEVAEDCHLDVSCYPDWSSSAAGVAMIIYEKEGGTYSCSGALLNNRREDYAPYFLTAAHCVSTAAEARSVVVLWRHQTRTCGGEPPNLRRAPQTRGARLLATVGGGVVGGTRNPDGDMTLLRLEGDLPSGVVFQGWDATPPPFGARVTGIHHPGSEFGVFKRISFGQTFAADEIYASVRYTSEGRVEPGSSGSALFSRPGTVVGAASFISVREEEDLENVCQASELSAGYTHFSVFYPHIWQFVDGVDEDDAPLISSGGIVLTTGPPPYVRRISPNSLVTVYGQGLASVTASESDWQSGNLSRLPTVLGGACLEIDGERAPLFSVSPYRIEAQVPHTLATGQEARVAAVRGCGARNERRSLPARVATASVTPAFFLAGQNPNGRNPVLSLHLDDTALSFTPAEPGEFVALVGTGFGKTLPPLEAGQIPEKALPEIDGLARLVSRVSFTIGGVEVPAGDVTYAGAFPCCPGVYLFVVRAPSGLPDGRAPISATVAGVSTPEGPYLEVRRRRLDSFPTSLSKGLYSSGPLPSNLLRAFGLQNLEFSGMSP